MLALCVESSHERGMGHFFRALNLFGCLERHRVPAVFVINLHAPSVQILSKRRLPFEIVEFHDFASRWEQRLIRSLGIRIWVNDRLDTDRRHAQTVKDAGILLVTLDDRGSGAEFADMNIAALAFEDAAMLRGKRVLHGLNYLILNPEIESFRRHRTKAEKILVTLGGSDTHGVTKKAAAILGRVGKTGTIVLGPGFDPDQTWVEPAAGFSIKRSVPSLIQEFSHFDLAVTGGGITPIEANASGLPCIVVACEAFEVPVGRHLERLGSSVYAGFHRSIDERVFSEHLDVSAMSRAGLDQIPLDGAERIVAELGLS